MGIEKIKNYNQKLLAVLGTIAAIFLLIGLISFIPTALYEFNRFDDDDMETGILSEEKIEALQKENKREQIISYRTPKLIDTINGIYIIPVGHKNLNQPESITKEISGLLNASGDFNKEDYRYSGRYYGNYNNVLVFDEKTNSVKKLFAQRVNFSGIQTEYFEDETFLLIEVASKDTYKDGVINLQDLKSLFIYSLTTRQLKQVSQAQMDIEDYKFVNDSKDLIIRFGIDKNKDGKYDEFREPVIIKKYNFGTAALTDIISPELHMELQRTLEGSE